MKLMALYKRVIGLDIHQAQITACALIEEADGSTHIEQRQFGGFKRDRRELADWVASLRPDEVVMESTGMSKMSLAARRTWVMPTGWRRWRARGCCAARLCHPPNCANCV